MIVLSGVSLLLAVVLLAVGVTGPTSCVYASLAVLLLAAGMLPLGAARRGRRAATTRGAAGP